MKKQFWQWRVNGGVSGMNNNMRSWLVWLTACCLLLALSSAQDPAKDADAQYERNNFALALEGYKKVLEKHEASLRIVQRIAHCYRFLNNSQEAEFWYAQTMTFPQHGPENIRHFADAARKNGNYEKAKLLYLRYAQEAPQHAPQALAQAANCDQVRQWIAAPAPFVLRPLDSISSANLDFSPVFYQQGLVFTSDRPVAGSAENVSGWTGKPLAKLYYARQQNGGFTQPQPLPEPLNSQFENGSAVFNKTEDQVYFTRVNKVKANPGKEVPQIMSWVKFAAETDFINRLEIYHSEKRGDVWTDPQPFPFNKISEYSIGHPALTPSGDTLYFASDMPGGFGDTDIYFSVKMKGGSWSKPRNAGKAINTPAKELFPVVRDKGRFYFSSEGHSGMGGLDIYQAQGTGSHWKQVENLRYPLNSSSDDFGILFDKSGQQGYLSTNRNSADGSDNIYAFSYVAPTCRLTGWTLENIRTKTGEVRESPVSQVRVRISNDHDTSTVALNSDAFGNFTFEAREGVAYTIQGSKKGYLTTSAPMTAKCQSVLDLIKTGLTLHRDVLNKPIVLDRIYYDVNSYKIRPEAAEELNKLVQIIKDNPGIKIELSSHTDCRASKGYNQLLSQMRADAAVAYILTKGVPESSIVAKGYGESRLLNSCTDGVSCPELQHQMNRRTEFTILAL